MEVDKDDATENEDMVQGGNSGSNNSGNEGN